MNKLRTNYMPGDPVTSASANEVNAAINTLAEKVEQNALNINPNGDRYHAVFKDHSNDGSGKPDTLEIATYTVVSFEAIQYDEYDSLTKYEDKLPDGFDDPTKIYREEKLAEAFLTIPYTKGDGKGDDSQGWFAHKWGNGKKGTVYADFGVMIGGKYYKFVLNDMSPRIQIESGDNIELKAGNEIQLESDTNVVIDAKDDLVVKSKVITLDGTDRFEFNELEEGLFGQFKSTKTGTMKGCDKISVEVYNNKEDDGQPSEADIAVKDADFLKGTRVEWWYVIENAGNGGTYDKDSNTSGEWIREVQDSDKKTAVAESIWGDGETNKSRIDKKFHHFDMSTDTFYNDESVHYEAKEKKIVASAHLYDIIKFTAWAKTTQFGPWANQE